MHNPIHIYIYIYITQLFNIIIIIIKCFYYTKQALGLKRINVIHFPWLMTSLQLRQYLNVNVTLLYLIDVRKTFYVFYYLKKKDI